MKEKNSAERVSDAANAGGTGRRGGHQDRGFRLALAAVIASGVFLVGFSWNVRDVAALTPTFGDHWHAAYGVWDCEIEDFRPNLIDPQDINDGIHTHSDGVIHIHPYSSRATGNNAILQRFLEATNSAIDGEVLSFSDQEALVEGTMCGGEPAILQVARFAPNATVPTEVITEDLGSFRFNEDLEMVVIALAPVGVEIPPPPAANIAAAQGASPHVLRTDGLAGIDNDSAVGFDDEGNLRDLDGNLVLDDAGDPLNLNSITSTDEEG